MPESAVETKESPVKGSLLAGKRGLIMGVANDRSIAWGIAAACAAQGAELGFTFQGEALGKRVRPLAESVGSALVVPCDVGSEEGSMRRSRRSRRSGTGSTSWFTPSASPTRRFCAAAISTRRARRSCRPWTSPATPSPPSASAPCR